MQASAAVRPVTGSATASAQNSGTWSFQTTNPPAAAASSPKATRLAVARAPVAGDGDPDPRSAVTHQVGTDRAPAAPALADGSLRSRRRPVAPGRAGSGRRHDLQIQRDRSFASVQQVEELAGPRRAPSGRCDDSTLSTVAPARARRSPHSGPAHSAERSTTTSPLVSAGVVHRRGTTGTPVLPRRLADQSHRQPEQLGPFHEKAGSRSRRSEATAAHMAGTEAWHGIELEPGGNRLHVLGARQRHGHEAVAGREEAAAPAAAHGAAAPQPHQRGALTQERQPVQPGERAGQPVDPFDQAGRAGPAAGRAARSAPWRRSPPSAAPGGAPCGQGNVSRSSNRSAPKHCSPSCGATSPPSATAPCRSPCTTGCRSRRGTGGRIGEPALRRRRRDRAAWWTTDGSTCAT